MKSNLTTHIRIHAYTHLFTHIYTHIDVLEIGSTSESVSEVKEDRAGTVFVFEVVHCCRGSLCLTRVLPAWGRVFLEKLIVRLYCTIKKWPPPPLMDPKS
jgi:hypothetical protein